MEDGINFYAPEARPQITKAVQEAMEEQKPYDLELPFITARGREIWVRTQGMVQVVNGEPVRLYGAIQDITDRKAAEERFRRAIEEAPYPVMLHVEDGTVIAVNRAWLESSGFAQEQIATIHDWVEKAYPENSKETLEKITRLYDVEGAIDEGEVELQTASGEKRIWRFSTAPLGKLVDGRRMVISMALDTTELHQAAREQARLMHILDTSLNEIYIFDPVSLRFEYTNEGARRNLGYDPETLNRLTPLDLKPEFTRETFEKMLAPLRQRTKDRLLFQTVHRRADGSEYPVEVQLQLVEQGSESAFLAIINDITERKAAEAMLADSERKYRDLVETSHDLIWAIDADGLITFMNRASERIYGYPPEELIGKHWTVNTLEWDEEDATRIAREIAHQGGNVSGQLSRMHHRSGREVILQANAIQHFDDAGNYIGASGTSQDVTEILKAAEEVRQSREQLRDLIEHQQAAIEEERAHIAREIHDEFGQMMTGLKMDLAWLERNTKVSVKQKERLSAITNAVDDAINTIRRISSELRPGLLDDLGLFPALEWLSKEYSHRANLDCTIEVPAEEPDMAPDLRTAVFRIFQEALTNVVRHAEATQVESKLRLEDNMLVLTVRDNGRGIDYSSLEDPKSLGLLGMKERAVKWGGSVEIKGNDDGGTTVSTRIPL